MSKSSQLDDDLPPPYTESSATGTQVARDARPPPSFAGSLTSPLAAHLRALPSRMRASEQARSTQQAAFDLDLITLIIPHVEDFLSDLGSMPSSPPMAELTLVPAAAVPKIWSMTGAAERRREGEILRVARVADEEDLGAKPEKGKGRGGQSSSTGREFDSSGWGRWDEDDDDGISGSQGSKKSWWWQDEAMARRLAAHIRPAPPMERKQVQAIVAKAKEEKKASWGWGRKKTAGSSSTSPAAAAPPSPTVSAPVGSVLGELDERVSMSVRADEVTFRRENDFGVWESLNGYGIVVVVKIRR